MNVTCDVRMTEVFAVEQAFFKAYESFMLLQAIIQCSNTKIHFSKAIFQFSSDLKTLCNYNNQTWFSNTRTFARPLDVVETLAF